MKKSNTVVVDQGIEVYTSEIYRLVDEYIETVLQVSPEKYEDDEKYKEVVRNNRIDMFFYIADHIQSPDNGDIELLDRLFGVYIRICAKYGISPTLQMFGVMVGINNGTFSDWAGGQYRAASKHSETVKKWKDMCGAFALDKLHNQTGTNANLIFACKVAYGMAETAPIQTTQTQGIPTRTAAEIAAAHRHVLDEPEPERPVL